MKILIILYSESDFVHQINSKHAFYKITEYEKMRGKFITGLSHANFHFLKNLMSTVGLAVKLTRLENISYIISREEPQPTLLWKRTGPLETQHRGKLDLLSLY